MRETQEQTVNEKSVSQYFFTFGVVVEIQMIEFEKMTTSKAHYL